MSKDIKEFIHYYLGQQFMMTKPSYRAVHEFGLSSDTPFAMSGKFADYFHGDAVSAEVKPILRKLESMSEDEIIESARLMTVKNIPEGTPMKVFKNDSGHLQISIGDENAGVSLFPLSTFGGNPELFHYLLSRGFDLFGLIDAGVAIDKETLK